MQSQTHIDRYSVTNPYRRICSVIPYINRDAVTRHKEHTHMIAYAHTHTRARTHTHMRTHTRAYKHTRARAHTHTHTHARTHARTHTHTHTHRCSHAPYRQRCSHTPYRSTGRKADGQKINKQAAMAMGWTDIHTV